MDDSMAMAGSLLDWLNFQAAGLPNMIFFNEINSFLDDEIGEFAGNLLGRVLAVVGAAVLSLLTLWILIQGYRIATGQSREPMMALMTNSLKAVLIIGIATGAAAGAGSIYGTLTNGLTDVVNEVMTGDADGGPYADIDRTLAIMQVALEVIDSVDTSGDAITDQDKVQALWLAGAGLGGPAIMAATALLLNKIAIALIVGLGPIFILCLLFEPTKPLFNNWSLYGIGTLFSLALLTVMVTLALDMVIAVGLAFWASSWLSGSEQESLTAMALQQGGLGLILTLLIISVPPMAAVFFRGVLGHFSAYSAFGQGGRASPSSAATYPPTSHPPLMNDVGSEAYRAQTHPFRGTPSQQADEIKWTPAQESFIERYPNALASLDGHGGNGDPLPASLRTLVVLQHERLRTFSSYDIRITGDAKEFNPDEIEQLGEVVARDMNVMEHMLRRSGNQELSRKFKELVVELNFDNWSAKYAGTQNSDAYAQAYYVGNRIELNAHSVRSADTMHYRVSQIAHELRHLMKENDDKKDSSSGSPSADIENDAREFSRDFMRKYWRP